MISIRSELSPYGAESDSTWKLLRSFPMADCEPLTFGIDKLADSTCALVTESTSNGDRIVPRPRVESGG